METDGRRRRWDSRPSFVLGLDLDGTCADFYGRMREIAAEWGGLPLESLPLEPDWSLEGWGIREGGYEDFHRFAVTQRDLFATMAPLEGAPQAIRRLAAEGVRIRIITHRLVISYFHETAVAQTVRWLDHHGIPYWDLCFMREKGDVDADLYVEDAVGNIERLVAAGEEVLVISNGTNRSLDLPVERAESWAEAEGQIRHRYLSWLDASGLERPPGPGQPPRWMSHGNAPDERSHVPPPVDGQA
jgi:5'(3')-deoxyribonucleotidase